MRSKLIKVEVVFGLPERQVLRVLAIEEGVSAREAVVMSGLQDAFPDWDLNACSLGVFGQTVKEDYLVKDGDRIEIYRPLLADPRDVRKRLAAEGKTMGRQRRVASTSPD